MTNQADTVCLSDIAYVISGTSPSGRDINDRSEGLPFFQGAKEFGTRHPRPERFTTAPVKTASAGDILLSVRAPVGRVNIADTACAIGRGVMAVRPRDAADGPYIAAFLRMMGEAWDAHSTDGTMFANLSKVGLEQLPVRWPLMRHKIAEVLGALDDAVEVSRTLIASLEASIELEAATVLQSAGEETQLLTEIATIVNGYSYNSSELVDESETAMVNLKNFGRRGGFRLDGLKPFDGKPKPAQMLVFGDAMVAKTDLTQDAEVIGRCLRMPELPQFENYVASLDIAIVRTKGQIPQLTLCALLAQPEFRDHCLGFVNGTTVLHMSKSALETYAIPVLADSQVSDLTTRVEALAAHQDRTLIELYHLEEMRDFLLPRLVSGELRVAATEELVGAKA
jgi:type I restriction enzyme S subunit